MNGSAKDGKNCAGACYRIVIEGAIREDWSDWLCGMDIRAAGGHHSPQVTILTGSVSDQSALRGILCRLWDLNLVVVSLKRVTAAIEERE